MNCHQESCKNLGRWLDVGGTMSAQAYCDLHVPVAQEEKPWPQDGDAYWHVDGRGEARLAHWRDAYYDWAIRYFLGIFRTEQEAKDRAALVKRILKAHEAAEAMEKHGVETQCL